IAMGPVADTGVERLLREQIQAMSRMMSEQIGLLGGTRSVADQLSRQSPAAPAPAPAAQPRPPSSQALDTFAVGLSASELTHTKQLTPVQQRYLDTFTARYNRRTQKSKQFTQAYRPTWADIRSTMGFRHETKELCYTLVAERSSGSRMWDIDGNEYIDVAMGFGVHLFGHN